MRRLSVSNLNAQRFKYMPFLGEWKRILGEQERTGCWIIYGKEKNGKSTFALQLAKSLAKIEPVLYISAEEGTGSSYTKAVHRVGITERDRNFHSWPFVSINDLRQDIIALVRDFPRTLFIFIAHEDDKGEPQGSPAVRAKQMAYAIFHVKGLAAFATIRGDGEGGRIDIDEETASLIHGDRTIDN